MKSKARRTIALVAAVTLLASACGGGTSVEVADLAQSQRPDPTATQGDPSQTADDPTTDADTPDDGGDQDERPPDQDAGDPTPTPLATPRPDPTSTSAPDPDLPPFDPAFCDAITTVVATAAAADGLDPADPRLIEAWFTEMLVVSDDAVAAAPGEPFAAATARSREIVGLIGALAADFDYDVTSPEAGEAFQDQLEDEAAEFDALQDLFEDYVHGTCDVDRSTVADLADDIAIGIEETVIPPPPPSDTVSIADSLGVISFDVPFQWTSISENPGLDSMTLVASPDISAYVNGWTTSGVEITVVPFDGRFDLSEIAPESRAAFDCELIEVDDYDDGRLLGQITLYQACVADGTAGVDTTATDAAVIAATTDDGAHAVLIQITLAENDAELLPLVLLTLEIDPTALPTP